jgi:hypothetical protein
VAADASDETTATSQQEITATAVPIHVEYNHEDLDTNFNSASSTMITLDGSTINTAPST